MYYYVLSTQKTRKEARDIIEKSIQLDAINDSINLEKIL